MVAHALSLFYTKIEDVSATSGTGERIRSMENVVNFLKSVRALGLPYTTAFNMPDLEAAGPEERPRVAECIMALKRLHERVDLKTVALPTPPTPAAATPPTAAARPPPPPPTETPEALTMEAARAVVADRSADGVLSLMNQCTSMLKQRMMPGTPSGGRPGARPADAAALDTVGPVLESVLANLTQEYEKRLLAKDQEVKAAVEGQQRLQMEVVLLQEELHITRKQLQEVKLLTGPGVLVWELSLFFSCCQDGWGPIYSPLLCCLAPSRQMNISHVSVHINSPLHPAQSCLMLNATSSISCGPRSRTSLPMWRR